MRKFIIKISFISIPIIVLGIVMELLLRSMPNDYLVKKSYLDNHATEIETLILGSSHTYYGLNPEYFTTKTFNASYVSQTLNFDYTIFQQYKSNFKSLKTIVLPISYFSLWENLWEGEESWRVKNYILYYGLDSKRIKDHSEVLSIKTRENLKKLASYYVFGKSYITSSSLGWSKKHEVDQVKNLVKSGKMRAQINTYPIFSKEYEQIFNDNILILNNFIQYCEEQNIRVLIINPPAYETFRNNLDAEQLRITISVSENLASTYKNCTYLNLISAPTFSAIDFYDADHLSEIGAKKLSLLIDKEICELK